MYRLCRVGFGGRLKPYQMRHHLEILRLGTRLATPKVVAAMLLVRPWWGRFSPKTYWFLVNPSVYRVLSDWLDECRPPAAVGENQEQMSYEMGLELVTRLSVMLRRPEREVLSMTPREFVFALQYVQYEGAVEMYHRVLVAGGKVTEPHPPSMFAEPQGEAAAEKASTEMPSLVAQFFMGMTNQGGDNGTVH